MIRACELALGMHICSTWTSRRTKENEICLDPNANMGGGQGEQAGIRETASQVQQNLRDMGGQVRDAATEQYNNLRSQATQYFEEGRKRAGVGTEHRAVRSGEADPVDPDRRRCWDATGHPLEAKLIDPACSSVISFHESADH